MKLTFSLIFVAAFTGLSSVNAAGFTDCADLATAIAGTPQGQNRANDYCRVYMGMTPVTATSTSTSIRGTKTVSTADYTTTLVQVTPATFTRQVNQRLTTSITVTPATRVTTSTITSTAYIANDGTTIAIAKRSLQARARLPTVPAFFSGFNGRELKAACRCVNAPRPTITKRVTTGVYATVTKTQKRRIAITTTLPAPRVTNTNTLIATKVFTMAAPVAATSVVEIEDVRGCPPNTDTTFTCPDSTGDDDQSDPNYQTCSVQGLDDFAGNCVYWSDDGSPVESTLIRGDGSGESDFDASRQATYGDAEDDDCPSWANYTCAVGGAPGQKRSLFVRAAGKNHGSSRSRGSHVPQKMPKKAPRRGGKFVPWAEYQQRLLQAMADKN